MYRFFRRMLCLTVVAAAVFSPAATAQDVDNFAEKVTEFTLDNGLHFIIVERHEAPVVSLHTYANVGSVDEVKGITGMAHMFEHMAFKGTTEIGTKDWESEKEALAKLDGIFDEIRAEKAKGAFADQDNLDRLQEEFAKAQEEASEFVNDEYEEALQHRGGSGLNASTWYDATNYTVSMPSNQLETWMYLESERWRDPVLREFYKERNVVMEERRMRTENQPIGKLLEEFMATCYKAHPYGEPPVGHASDIQSYTRDEAKRFFETYYAPNNLTIAIVGDVDPGQAKKLAKEYFERIPRRADPPHVETIEPKQQGERRVTIFEKSQPIVLMGFHKPDMYDPDNAVFDAISDILGNGRTSRLHQSLVKEQKIAIAAGGFAGLLGGKYPDVFIFFAVPAQGHTADECEEALLAEIDKIRSGLVEERELAKARTRARATLIRGMGSNSGLGAALSEAHALRGNWREVFYSLDRIDAVTADDIKRVAGETFIPSNRTVAVLKSDEPAS